MNMKKSIFYILSFTAAIVIMMDTIACSIPYTDDVDDNNVSGARVSAFVPDEDFTFVPAGVVMPHHLLVEKDIKSLYAKLAQRHAYKRIVIISPNHFNYGYHYISTTDVENEKFPGQKVDQGAFAKLIASNVVFNEPKKFYLDHGVTNHIPFVQKYFPDAVIVPIQIKSGANENKLNILADTISALIDEDTLVLASIDFSHYVPEPNAVENDKRTIQLLKDWSMNGPNTAEISYKQVQTVSQNVNAELTDGIAMDSPETFYVLLRVMEISGNRNFNFVKRTSSAEILGVKDPTLNTSHIFGVFGK
jgi:AmmeMemoRadiSam system protein B